VQPETRYARAGEAYVGYQVIGDGPLDVVFIPADPARSSSRRRSRISLPDPG